VCSSDSISLQIPRLPSVRYGISKAFLATDDPEAYNVLKERLPHIDFVTLESFDRTKLQSGDQVGIRRPQSPLGLSVQTG
jgi:hypothetical protein